MMAYMLFYVPEFKKNRLFLKIHDKVKWYLQEVVGLAQSKWFKCIQHRFSSTMGHQE